MASVIINDDNLKNIAQAIREKGETNETYTPSEMADAIRSISDSGGTPNAVQYVPQTLTDAQKAQARTNIGAGVPVTIDSNLTTTGAAADAKTVGDRFNTVNENLDMALMSGSFAQEGALTWNGVIGDKEYVVMAQFEMGIYAFVHVSDEVPKFPAGIPIAEFPILMGIGMFEASPVQMVAALPFDDLGGGAYFGEAFAIIPSDNYAPPEEFGIPVTFPKAGVYAFAINMLPNGMDLSMQWGAGLWIPGYSFSSGGGGASKYFEKTTGTKHVGDTLTWDGEIGEREHVVATVDGRDQNFDIYGTYTYVRVSEQTPTFEELSEAQLTLHAIANGAETTVNAVPQQDSASGVTTMASAAVVICYTAGTVLNLGLGQCVLPSPGIYFVKVNISLEGAANTQQIVSLNFPGYDFVAITGGSEVIKTEHLPEALRFGEIETEIRGDTLTWDGNTEGKINLDGEGFYLVSDAVPTLAELQKGGTVLASTSAGAEESVQFDAANVGSINENGTVLMVASGVTIAFIISSEYVIGGITYPTGFYLNCNEDFYISSFTINDYNGFVTKSTELVTIDPKYLPAGIGGGGNVNVDGILAEAKEYTNNTVSTHNTDTNAHNDIRNLINAFTLNSFGVTATATELNYVDGVTSNIQTQLNEKASSNHTQSASTITAGTFAGQVVANSSYQSPTTSLLRNSKLVSTDTNPTINGEIYWTYE